MESLDALRAAVESLDGAFVDVEITRRDAGSDDN
jgi:hypothetical protein